jgi:hypothetical protein
VEEITVDWLENLNKQYREQDISPAKRPWLAVQELAGMTKRQIAFNGTETKMIFDWFANNTKPGSQIFGPYYKAAFYFDSSFWEVTIPHVCGIGKPDAFASLAMMPNGLKEALKKDKKKNVEFISLWVDSLDYAYGFGDLVDSKVNNTIFLEILKSAHKELTASVSLILEQRPNSKVVESARMGTEMFLKAFLIANAGYGEKDIKRIGHDIGAALEASRSIKDSQEFLILSSMITKFPDIAYRYKGIDVNPKKMWEAYIILQFAATSVVRILSGRDNRNNIVETR